MYSFILFLFWKGVQGENVTYGNFMSRTPRRQSLYYKVTICGDKNTYMCVHRLEYLAM